MRRFLRHREFLRSFAIQKMLRMERRKDGNVMKITLLTVGKIKEKYPAEISGGEKQRTAVARAKSEAKRS